jgi:hypothetical protein
MSVVGKIVTSLLVAGVLVAASIGGYWVLSGKRTVSAVEAEIKWVQDFVEEAPKLLEELAAEREYLSRKASDGLQKRISNFPN